jgi:addiction module HigA family antidote
LFGAHRRRGRFILARFCRKSFCGQWSTGYRLAKSLAIKPQTVNDIVPKKRGISADMAVRLARFFGTSPEFWMNLQSAYELAKVRATFGRKIEKIQPHRSAA